MNKQPFKFAYIDAFAGTGYRDIRHQQEEDQLSLFNQDEILEANAYSAGSARIALRIEPEFDKYIFIEKSGKRCNELRKLLAEFRDKAEKIEIVHNEANQYIVNLCLQSKWSGHRAVMFLDPYGMQVNWDTIEAVARTQAVDLWYLFPLGVGLNRMLKRDANDIPEGWKGKINALLGTSEWSRVFYHEQTDATLFGEKKKLVKDTDFQRLSDFIVRRLKTIFAGVVDNPLMLHNSKNNPLYLLCFAAGNPKGAIPAVRIAQDIIGRP